MKNQKVPVGGRVSFQQIVCIDSLSGKDGRIQQEPIEIDASVVNSVAPTHENSDSPSHKAKVAEIEPVPTQEPKEESQAAPPKESRERIYRIDDKHDKFQPSRLLAEPRLHVSVKATPAKEQVELEQVLREKRAIRISKGNDVQQIVVSTYESVSLDEEIGEIAPPGDLAANSTWVNLPQWHHEIIQPVENRVNETESVTTAGGGDDSEPIESVKPPEDSIPIKSSEPALSNEPANNILETTPEVKPKQERPSAPIVQVKARKEEVIKPAWEVVAFRWPSTIRKLSSEHRNAFKRLLESLQQNHGDRLTRIGVIHTVAGQGATTLATCLSKILAESGKNVLLADLDLENPGIEDIANIQLNQGWQQLLEKDESINEYLVRDASENLTLMPLGNQFDLVSKRPGMLEKMKQISGNLSQAFDFSIVDIGNVKNLMIEEKCHVGFLDGAVIVSNSSVHESTSVAIYEKLVAAGVPSVVIAENFRSQTKSAA